MTRTLLPILLLAGTSAWAGARRIPTWGLDTDDEVQAAVKDFGFGTEGKPKAWPKKVAVPYFQIRYDFTTVEGDATATRVQFTEADYQRLTDDLYAHFVAYLEADGFEVVGRDAVVAAAAYGALEGDTEPKESGGRGRYAASGLKNLNTRFGKPTKPGALTPLNGELGTDAVVAVFANIALCNVEYTARTGMAGTKPCLRGGIGVPGLSVLWLGDGWESHTEKQVVMYTYASKEMADGNLATREDTAETYDAALISPHSGVSWNKKDFWGDRSGDPEVGAFALGARDMFDVGLTLGMETFYRKGADAMSAAGVARPARHPAPPFSRVALGKEAREDRKEMQANIEDMKAKLEEARVQLAATPEGPPLSGTMVCWEVTGTMTNAAGTVPSPPTVLRRGYDGARMVESYMQRSAAGPFTSKSVFEVAGSEFAVTDLKGYYTGAGTFEGGPTGWTGWHSEMTSKDATMIQDARTEGTDLVVTLDVKMPDGTIPVKFVQTYAPLDPAACDARWTELATPVAAAPTGKDKKKK